MAKKLITRTVRLEMPLNERLEGLAKAQGVSFSKVARAMIERGIRLYEAVNISHERFVRDPEEAYYG